MKYSVCCLWCFLLAGCDISLNLASFSTSSSINSCLYENRRDIILVTADAILGSYDAFAEQPIKTPIGYRDTGIRWNGKDIFLDIDRKVIFGIVFQNLTNQSDYIFAFRGTDDVIELAENFEFTPTKFTIGRNSSSQFQTEIEVEQGFFSIYQSMRAELFETFNELKPENLIITGHSLGGPLAQMFTADLLSQNIQTNVQLITYAAARPGNKAFQNYLKKRLQANQATGFSVNNVDDIVPDLPPFFAPGLSDIFSIKFSAEPFITGNHRATNYLSVIKALPICQ